MKISILTLFPEMFQGPFDCSILKRAKYKKLINIKFVNIRDFGIGKHKIVDDAPYGGGVGMVMRVDVIKKAVEKTKCKEKCKEKVFFLDPRGKTFNQKKAVEISKLNHIILICGHYEGIDERVRKFIDEEISIGDYVLTGGEIPAMVIVDCISRLLQGVLKKEEATRFESFSQMENLVEYPQYTRPQDFNGQKVPNILLSGNHKEIAKWRKNMSLTLTKSNRPDLLKTSERT
ncbi:MAG: tRNA (guanosine(37)-N1)-methyltransferase TrmD [Candidatus Levyibacteriota bacterium]